MNHTPFSAVMEDEKAEELEPGNNTMYQVLPTAAECPISVPCLPYKVGDIHIVINTDIMY